MTERSRRSSLWPILDVGEDEHMLWLRWLVRLRWVAIVAQIVTLSFAFTVFASPWVAAPLIGVILVLALVNLWAMRSLGTPTTIDQTSLITHLGVDVVALTAFFALGGGPENPFTILYVIHVAFAAIMLRPRLAAALTTLVLACYGLLHVHSMPLDLEQHVLPEGTLVVLGRVLAFTIASVSVAFFVSSLSATLRRRSTELLEARDRTARTDRLRSVGTLAAGAAHELNTPLSTIGLRVRRVARRLPDDADTQKDLDVVRAQLERCKLVVEQLLVGAGDPSAGGFVRVPLAELVHETVGLWSKGSDIGVDVEDASDGLEVELPRVAFSQALINLLQNAREAQEAAGRGDAIRISVERDGRMGVVRIRDRGCGLPPAADRVGEPFFTTKSQGTGLGVFVARAVADGAGGGLSYRPGEGGGTEARWWFPEVTRRPA